MHGRRHSTSPASGTTALPQPATTPEAKSGTRRRRWFRCGAALLPVIGLVLLEIVLRLAGYGYPTAFWVSHPAVRPPRLVENRQFSWRFFPRTLARHPDPQVIQPTKAPGVYRILVLGESAAQGDPAPAFGFSRILDLLLRERFPGIQFEIVNTAFTAINSHVILRIAHDSRLLRANAWLVYMGHNEVVGPFGTGTVFGYPAPPLTLVRTQLRFKETRTGQLLDAIAAGLHSDRESAAGWGGMNMFLERQIRQDDLRLESTLRYFGRNLEDIFHLAHDAGARVIVSTMVSRLRDWAPFASSHREDLTDAEQREWNRLYLEGTEAEAAGNPTLAIQRFGQANAIDDQFAELHFRWGRCLLALHQPGLARSQFLLARDLDTLRFRADSRLNETIRQTAASSAGQGIVLIEADRIFDQRSPHGIAGGEWLLEHIHLNFAGNYQLALLFAQGVAAGLPLPTGSEPAQNRPWLDEEECAARLGYSDFWRHETAAVVRRRLDEPVYQGQIDHAEHLALIEKELARLRGATKPAATRRALEICRQASQLAPDDWRLRDLAAHVLENLGEQSEAIAEWRRVSSLIPHTAAPATRIGTLRLELQDTEGALAAFNQALSLDPDDAAALAGLGLCHLQLGHRTEATRAFRRALRLDPTRADARAGLAHLAVHEQANP